MTEPIEDGEDITQELYNERRTSRNWIPSSEQLPENNEEVLCFNGFRMIQNSYSIGSDQDQAWFKRTFSHWRKLPERPKL